MNRRQFLQGMVAAVAGLFALRRDVLRAKPESKPIAFIADTVNLDVPSLLAGSVFADDHGNVTWEFEEDGKIYYMQRTLDRSGDDLAVQTIWYDVEWNEIYASTL